MSEFLNICYHKLIGQIDSLFISISDVWAILFIFLLLISTIRTIQYSIRILRQYRILQNALRFSSKAVNIRSLTGDGRDDDYVYVFDEPGKLLAFNIGFMRPRIYLSSAIVNRLERSQVDIIIRHEKGHQSRRDPMRRFVLSLLSEMFWFVPYISSVSRAYALRSEVECDRKAIQDSHDSAEVARTLIALVDSNSINDKLSMASLSSVRDFLEPRIRILGGEDMKKFTRTSIKALCVSIAVLILSLTAGLGLYYGQKDPYGIHSRIVAISESCEKGHENVDLNLFGIECPLCSESGESSAGSCSH